MRNLWVFICVAQSHWDPLFFSLFFACIEHECLSRALLSTWMSDCAKMSDCVYSFRTVFKLCNKVQPAMSHISHVASTRCFARSGEGAARLGLRVFHVAIAIWQQIFKKKKTLIFALALLATHERAEWEWADSAWQLRKGQNSKKRGKKSAEKWFEAEWGQRGRPGFTARAVNLLCMRL